MIDVEKIFVPTFQHSSDQVSLIYRDIGRWQILVHANHPFSIKPQALLSLFDLDHFVGCVSTWRCANEHSSPNLRPFLFLYNKHSGGCHLFTEWVIASSLKVILARPSRRSTAGTSTSGTSGSRRFSLILLHERIRRRIRLCNFSHAYPYRGGKCNCFLSHIARWFAIANNLQEFFVHAVLSPDSWPRRSSQIFQFWLQSSYFEFPARYFFSPKFSICDNQVLTSSDESPGHTLPIRSWVSRTLVFLICTILPRCHQMGLCHRQ